MNKIKSELAKKQWKTKRNKMINSIKNSEKVKKSLRKANKVLKERWKDDKWRKLRIKQIKRVSLLNSKEASVKAKIQWKYNRDKMIKSLNSSKTRIKKSKATRELWKTGAFDDKILNSNKNHTWGKGNYYKNKYFKSSWEIIYAKYLDDNKIKWLYESVFFRLGKNKRYIPDFYLPETNEYIEIKGWMDKRSILKLSLMKRKFPKIKLKIIGEKQWKRFIKKI